MLFTALALGGLAAGLGSSLFKDKGRTSQSSSSSSTQRTSLPGIGVGEANAVNALTNYANQQGGIMGSLYNQAMQPDVVPQGISRLSPEDQDVLDQAYQGQLDELQRRMGIARDQFAGMTGMRGFASPVATSVSREFAPQFANLLSQKAQQQLGLGVNIRDFNEGTRRYNQGWRLGLTQANPTGLGNLANYHVGLRMAQPTTYTNSTGSGRGQSSYTPSPWQMGMAGFNAGQGMNISWPTGLFNTGGPAYANQNPSNPIISGLGGFSGGA